MIHTNTLRVCLRAEIKKGEHESTSGLGVWTMRRLMLILSRDLRCSQLLSFRLVLLLLLLLLLLTHSVLPPSQERNLNHQEPWRRLSSVPIYLSSCCLFRQQLFTLFSSLQPIYINILKIKSVLSKVFYLSQLEWQYFFHLPIYLRYVRGHFFLSFLF